MHYYQFNIGDYARDTSHLSLIEHGIYRLLLDWCYLNEKPITTEKAMRVGRGFPTETQSVLSEFFFEVDGGWQHPRVAVEIQHFHKKAEINRLNGSKGGRPKPTNNPVGSQSQPNRNPNQEPITNNQEPYIKPKTATATQLPDWLPEASWNDYMETRKVMKSPMTDRAKALAISKLDDLRKQGYPPADVLNQSVYNGWKGLFPIKDGNGKGKSRHEQIADKWADITGRSRNSDADAIDGSAERMD